jgi:ABC-type ATPase with predicted acetyltransferase domain
MTCSPLQARSRRCRAIARWFGVTECAHQPFALPERPELLLPRAGQVTLITGPSGSGKSTLLRAIARAAPPDVTCINVEAQRPPDRALIDCFPRATAADAMRQLSRVGLCEAFLALRRSRELSDGQRWRLRLALALHRAHTKTRTPSGAGPILLLCDEFAALLDRLTAMVISRSLRRLIRTPIGAILATSHDDLARALQPDTIIRCDFGAGISIQTCNATPPITAPACTRTAPNTAAPPPRSPGRSASSSRGSRSAAWRPS